MNSEVENKKISHKLLISLIFKRPKRISIKAKSWIQNKPYKYGLKIKNIDDKSSPEATIKNLSLKSAEGGDISNTQREEFSVPILNPGQEIDIWWPDPMAPVIKGSSWISCFIIPKDDNQSIQTYQFNKFSRKPEIFTGNINQWGDAVVIRGELEEKQERTNLLLLFLTILMFLDGTWGLDVIIKFLFRNIGLIFSWIGDLLLRIS